MASVTSIINSDRYKDNKLVSVSLFKEEVFKNGSYLYTNENLEERLIGAVVDNILRVYVCMENGYKRNIDCIYKAFETSFSYINNIKNRVNECNCIVDIMSKSKFLDDEFIKCACKLVAYSFTVSRKDGKYFKDENNVPDSKTIERIRNLVNNGIDFIKMYGPVIGFDLSFEGGYTNSVSNGRADYLMEDCLWDLKVYRSDISCKDSLQLVLYYLLGLRSIHREKYLRVKKLGIYNPKKCKIYTVNIEDIDKSILENIEKTIIEEEN